MKTLYKIAILILVFLFVSANCYAETDKVVNKIKRWEPKDKIAKEHMKRQRVLSKRTDYRISSEDMPIIENFQQRELLRTAIELSDQNTPTFTYIVGVNQLIFIGKSVGFGIPAAASFSDGQRMGTNNLIATDSVLPEIGINGVFKAPQQPGTWILLINPKTNEPEITLIEPKIIISRFPLHSIN